MVGRVGWEVGGRAKPYVALRERWEEERGEGETEREKEKRRKKRGSDEADDSDDDHTNSGSNLDGLNLFLHSPQEDHYR